MTQNPRRARLGPCGLLVAALAVAGPAGAAESTRTDTRLEGYVAAILERELGRPPGSYEVQVREGRATVVLHGAAEGETEAVERALAPILGLEQLRVIASGAGEPGGDVPIVFPAGDLFRPLIADPKQPQFFISVLQVSKPQSVTAASVGYGETFGLWRWPGLRPGEGWQLSLTGGLFAQFNLDAPSNDLVNADYNIGFSLTHRHGPYSARARLYHQSSHLGDEFLLGQPGLERINLSFEAVDAIASWEWPRWRIYGGAGYIFNREPEDLEPAYAEAGIEYRGQRMRWDLGRLIGGVDLRSFEEQDWDVGVSVKAGIELGQADPGRRRIRILAEYYDGFSPFGQFFDTEIRYAGVGVYFGF